MPKESTIRQLIKETNVKGQHHPLLKIMSDALGYDVAKREPLVGILDSSEVAVVIIDDEPVGVLSVDWSEPCLIFKPCKNG